MRGTKHTHTHTPLIDKTFLPHPLFHTHPTVTGTFGLIFTITHEVTNLEHLLTYMSYLPHSRSITPHPPSNTLILTHLPVNHFIHALSYMSPKHIPITHSLAHMNHTKTYNIPTMILHSSSRSIPHTQYPSHTTTHTL